MAEKSTFVLNKNILSVVKKMPIEKAGQLFIHILEFENGLNPSTDDLVIDVAFEPIRQSLINYSESYEKAVQRNKINGSLGGRPKTKNNQVVLKETETKETESKKADNEYDKELPLGNSEIIKEPKAEKKTKFVPPTLQQLTDYIKENGYNVAAFKFLSHYQANGWMVGKTKMKDWKAAVRGWHSREEDKAQKPDENKVSKAFRIAQELNLNTADGRSIGDRASG